jgi:sec-independent protein translocase protein TatA
VPFSLGPIEVVVILTLVVLVFGAKKIPLIARSLGQGIRNFKGEVTSGSDDDEGRNEISAGGDSDRS